MKVYVDFDLPLDVIKRGIWLGMSHRQVVDQVYKWHFRHLGEAMNYSESSPNDVAEVHDRSEFVVKMFLQNHWFWAVFWLLTRLLTGVRMIVKWVVRGR